MALSGDGADELFAGYERYLVMRYSRYSDFIPLHMRKLMFGLPAKLLSGRGERSFIGRVERTLNTAASHSDKRYINLISRFNEI